MIRAAKYLGCRPWELFPYQDPRFWLRWATIAENTEERAKLEVAKRRRPFGK